MSGNLIMTFLELQMGFKGQLSTVLLFADPSVLNRTFNVKIKNNY